jgi:hypothetical protein
MTPQAMVDRYQSERRSGPGEVECRPMQQRDAAAHDRS